MIPGAAWEALQEAAASAGRRGVTWPKAWAAARRAWLRADPDPEGGDLPAGYFGPEDDDDAKDAAREAWHEGRREAGRPYVALVE